MYWGPLLFEFRFNLELSLEKAHFPKGRRHTCHIYSKPVSSQLVAPIHMNQCPRSSLHICWTYCCRQPPILKTWKRNRCSCPWGLAIPNFQILQYMENPINVSLLFLAKCCVCTLDNGSLQISWQCTVGPWLRVVDCGMI